MKASPEIKALAVVTGASSGIGAATARELARRGFHVLAGVRREQDAEALCGDPGVEPVMLDITRPAQIQELLERVEHDPEGRPLRALVNNAGMAVNVPVETYPLEDWRRLFEVNLFGHIAMTQALLPALIRARGRVVNISSVGGRMAMATYGPYAGTKFALEAVSDALRREVAPLGVDVIVIEPGAVRTGMPARAIAAAQSAAATMDEEQTLRYGDLMEATAAHIAAHTGEDSGVSSEAAAKVIARAIADRRPRTRYTIGMDAAIGACLTRILPDRLVDRILSAALRPHRPKAAA